MLHRSCSSCHWWGSCSAQTYRPKQWRRRGTSHLLMLWMAWADIFTERFSNKDRQVESEVGIDCDIIEWIGFYEKIDIIPNPPRRSNGTKAGSWCCGDSDEPNRIFHLNFGNEKPQRLVCSSSLHNWPDENDSSAGFPIVAIMSRTRDYYKPTIVPGRRLEDLYRWQCRRERADRDAEEIAFLIALAQRHVKVLRASRFAENDLESRSHARLRVFHVSFLKRTVPLVNRTVLTLRIANPWWFVARIAYNNSNNSPVHQSQHPSRIPRNPCRSNPSSSAWSGDWTIKTYRYDER